MHLSVAIYSLSQEDDATRKCWLNYYHKSSDFYVKNSVFYLWNILCVFNVDNLLLLTDDARRFNSPLQKILAFPFENYMQTMKGFMKGGRYPLQEII